MDNSPLRQRIFDLSQRTENWNDLQAILLTLLDKIHHLEESSQTPKSETSSALQNESGAAQRPWLWSGANRDSTPTPSVETILASSKYPPFTAPEWAAYLRVSSILQSMFEWRMTSGSTKEEIGQLGPAPLKDGSIMGVQSQQIPTLLMRPPPLSHEPCNCKAFECPKDHPKPDWRDQFLPQRLEAEVERMKVELEQAHMRGVESV